MSHRRLQDLVDKLRRTHGRPENFNFAVAWVPPEQSAAADAFVAAAWPEAVDFDALVLDRLEGAWEQAVAEEREGRADRLERALEAAACEVKQRVGDQPTVVVDIHLPATAGWKGLGGELYQASTRGVVVALVGASVRDGRIWLNNDLLFASTSQARLFDCTIGG